MAQYVCLLCGYTYSEEAGDVENGIEPDTSFFELDENFTCPLCGASKDDFELDPESEENNMEEEEEI